MRLLLLLPRCRLHSRQSRASRDTTPDFSVRLEERKSRSQRRGPDSLIGVPFSIVAFAGNFSATAEIRPGRMKNYSEITGWPTFFSVITSLSSLYRFARGQRDVCLKLRRSFLFCRGVGSRPLIPLLLGVKREMRRYWEMPLDLAWILFLLRARCIGLMVF